MVAENCLMYILSVCAAAPDMQIQKNQIRPNNLSNFTFEWTSNLQHLYNLQTALYKHGCMFTKINKIYRRFIDARTVAAVLTIYLSIWKNHRYKYYSIVSL